MLVIIAARHDPLAQALVTQWSAYGASLLTCTDLSTRGWRYELNAPARSTAVIGGQIVETQAITGVLTRLPYVFEQELTGIIREARSYVAAEMTAFLLSWLSNLPCPVLNQPTPGCLAGPAFRQEQWRQLAASLGIPVHSLRRSSSIKTPPEVDSVAVTVVGAHCFGAVDPNLARQARCLADAARVDLLTVHFAHAEAGASFIKADLWPDPTADGVQEAILAYLQAADTPRRPSRR